ncbi:LOW QUALITY PROTEIN: hypothetical protein U9M48_014126 [Paspalum notatum var. saurae]|uniref:Reverse transcriptase domain-containing protein n=1 Tax=Paspalum notatum var. saurae TaxID=547442 RepID=A0AAQ3WK69_PASNO
MSSWSYKPCYGMKPSAWDEHHHFRGLMLPPPNLSWRRDIVGPKLVAWNLLLFRIANITLVQEPDSFHWNLTQNGVFSVKSHYQALIRHEVPNLNKRIWKINASLKVKIFLWYLRKGVLLTKDNLAKRKWVGNKSCIFCHNDETIGHLFFEYRFARTVWSFIQHASNMKNPNNASHMLGAWAQGLPSTWQCIALLGAAAVCWSLWLCRNDLVFGKKTCYLRSSSLGAFVDYSLATGYTGTRFGGFAAINTSDFGYLLPSELISLLSTLGRSRKGIFFVKFKLCNKYDGFQWVLVSVYGPAQDQFKCNFLSELAQLCSKEALSILIGGDFNIICCPQEKNNTNYSNRWPFLFNAIIDAVNLEELKLNGRRYTWANNREVPTFEKLDRILVLNFGTIILIPKGNDVKQIQQYRPIYLLNVSFKIFTKVATNRVVKVATRIIKPTQTAFLPERNIMEGAIVLHETIHELHTKKHNGIIFKIDFEKHMISWNYLQQALRMKGFSPKWCSWVQAYVQGGNVGIKVNDHIGPYFQSKKGLRQEDPLSPILFNTVVDMLAIIMSRPKNKRQVKGVIRHLVEGGLSILQYVDDTAFRCMLKKLRNGDWKLIKHRIEKMLGNWKGKLLSYGGRLTDKIMASYLSTQRPRRYGCPESGYSEQMLVKRGLVGNKLLEWHGLVASLIHVNLEEGTYIFIWGLRKTGSFTVKSMYRALVNGIKMGTPWVRLWAQLQRTDDMKVDIVRTCRSLGSAVMELFASYGWPFMFRIGC